VDWQNCAKISDYAVSILNRVHKIDGRRRLTIIGVPICSQPDNSISPASNWILRICSDHRQFLALIGFFLAVFSSRSDFEVFYRQEINRKSKQPSANEPFKPLKSDGFDLLSKEFGRRPRLSELICDCLWTYCDYFPIASFGVIWGLVDFFLIQPDCSWGNIHDPRHGQKWSNSAIPPAGNSDTSDGMRCVSMSMREDSLAILWLERREMPKLCGKISSSPSWILSTSLSLSDGYHEKRNYDPCETQWRRC
jgi:hypothetical protein